jgi:L-alanine-DL-glutamate epimerase-like enolase superfamily enzyme
MLARPHQWAYRNGVPDASDLAISSIEAIGCSVPLRQAVSQGLGRAVKRDTVIIKVTTAGGLVGWGESYNGRAPLAIAATVNTTLRDLLTGRDATATTAAWQLFEDRVLANHGIAGPIGGDLGRRQLPLPRR